jgi:hypothetical protein
MRIVLHVLCVICLIALMWYADHHPTVAFICVAAAYLLGGFSAIEGKGPN